jgi:hypothetical protein
MNSRNIAQLNIIGLIEAEMAVKNVVVELNQAEEELGKVNDWLKDYNERLNVTEETIIEISIHIFFNPERKTIHRKY